MVASPVCPSPSQSAMREHDWSTTSFGVVSTREVIVNVLAILELDIGGIHKTGMGPYFCGLRLKCPPVMALYPPRTALWTSNQSAISQRDWDYLTVQGGVDPKNLRLLPRLMDVLEMWNDLWTGDGTRYPLEVELASNATHGKSGSQSAVGVRIYTPWGGVSCVDGFGSWLVTLSCPGNAYFVYESCLMPD